MKKVAWIGIWIWCGLLPIVAATYRPQQIPNVQRADARRYVSNPDGILSAETVVRLDSLCGALREQGLAEVAVVAVDDIAGGDAFSFAIELFRLWGVGRAADDNGLGILLVKDLREIRFVTGGGLEGVLTDALCKRIQTRDMLPEFRRGDYDAGMIAGLNTVAEVLEGGAAELRTQADEEDLPMGAVLLIVLAVMGIPIALIVVLSYAKKRCPHCHKAALRVRSRQVLSITPAYRLVERTYVCSACGHTVRQRIREPRDDHFGGGPFIGGFGGGFPGGGGSIGGGFGGGSFGGGGAGSKW